MRTLLTLLTILGAFSLTLAQQAVTVDIQPTISRAIGGELDLKRSRYFNLAASPNEINRDLDATRFNYYINDLEMTVGRKFQMVASESRWGNGFREDPNRPGWMDTTFFMNQKNPNDVGMDNMKNVWGANADVASHDARDAYPDFMPKYSIPDAGDDLFPTNNDAAAEMVAYYLQHNFTDFQRPSTFELVNEPHWRYWGDSRFIEHHVKAARKVKAMGVPVEIGGPCYSVGNFYKRGYGNLSHLTNFMTGTNFELDFYSFHIYDYMRWDSDAFDFVGAISSGLPEEGVFDALNAFHVNQTGRNFAFVGTEHGGYITNGNNREQALDTLADLFFPGSGFLHEMEKRSIDNFLMVNSAIANTFTFLNHPHIVRKAVPFILLETSRWDPTYYSSLLVKENFDRNSPNYQEAKLINFYKFFAGVEGRRILSHCPDTDIQHFAFRNDSTLILIFHNQSDVDGSIDLNLQNFSQVPQDIQIRRTGRNSDFRPFFSEAPLSDLNQVIAIGGQESIALFINYGDSIAEQRILDEKIYHSSETAVQFTGSRTFSIAVPDPAPEYAVLRVGLSRAGSLSKEVEIRLNGTLLSTPVEDCADRITGDDYATTKIIMVDAALIQANNTVQVSFPDGGEGGVGAVVLRVGVEDASVAQIEEEDTFPVQLFPNPSSTQINVRTHPTETLMIYNVEGRFMARQKATGELTQVDISQYPRGLYHLHLVSPARLRSSTFKVSP